MKIGATISPALLSLLENNGIQIDYIEVNGDQSAAQLRRALAFRPVLLHDIAAQFWLNYEDPFDAETMNKARLMLELARPLWHSTGIGASAEPQRHTTEFWRGAPESALQPRERCLANIIRNGRRLAAWLGLPLLLENFNYHPTNAYEYICEPETFSRLIDEIGCGVLLDLAHARISAFNLGWSDVHDYLAALPLAKVREIDLSHSEMLGDQQMVDRHLSIQEQDLDLLRWILEHAPNAEAITLESEEPDEAELMQEVALLRTIVG